MKRRQLLEYTGAGLLTAIAFGTSAESKDHVPPNSLSGKVTNRHSWLAQTADSVKIQWLGHTCFLFTGNGLRILVNPFRPVGCTAGYQIPNVEADLVLISSFLLDEGAVEVLPGNPRILTQSGDYQISGIKFQGISIAHDRKGGRRFGNNIAWRWNQGGINILHLGGAAAPIEIEQKILMGSPDLVLVPVGGGAKAYNPQEAKQAIEVLKPKVVIPTQYFTAAADKSTCDLLPVDDFLALTKQMQVSKLSSDTITIRPSDLPQEGTLIRVFSYG